jgi:methyl-accepting chemotaxis protein
MRLRIKIVSGFLILAAMLFLAGVWSVYELRSVGVSVQRLLDENYKSINAASSMVVALERQDSAVLLLLSGKWEDGRRIIESADRAFKEAFAVARKNITISGEGQLIDDIESKYATYKALWRRPIVDTKREGNLEWYFQDVHKAFLDLKQAVEKIRILNDQNMYQTASDLKKRGHRAVMPGIIAIVAALAFTLVFNYLINEFVVSPILRVNAGIRQLLDSGRSFNVEIGTKDELSDLVASIRQLAAKSHSPQATI